MSHHVRQISRRGTHLLGLSYFDVVAIFAATSKRSRAGLMLDWPTYLNSSNSERLLVDRLVYVPFMFRCMENEAGSIRTPSSAKHNHDPGQLSSQRGSRGKANPCAPV